ncbi:MAG: 4-hydroxyphenylacetate 3-monooxygenase, oxygenase component [Acidobacteriota bacterium]|nr:4-hydroxyphenylacetate 3-monooxygenase, oxygenase component [Acidobacteriota bacterium]
MPARTGAQYLEGLRAHPRDVWLGGRRLEDVTAHPAFRRPIARLARLYDLQHDPAHAGTLTCVDETGDRTGTAFLIPRTYDDLVARHRAFRVWAEDTFGLMGRSPDFLNCTLAAFADAADVFARGGQRYADHIRRYYEYVRAHDLLLTHALIPPQNDRSRTSGDQQAPFLHMGIVRETSDGPVLRGARMLATLGPIADEVLVYSLPGLRPGEEAHAIVFALPIDTPGLRQICRPPYDRGDLDPAEHPLASHFEECDSLIVFDDVLVPWERVFLYRDVDLCNALYPDSNLRQYTGHQTAVRGLVKLEFAVGVLMQIAQAVKTDVHLHVQDLLGECVNDIEIVKSCIARSEFEYETTPRGTVRPAFEPLITLRTWLPRVYPRIIEILQIVGAGGLLMVPSAADFDSPIAEDVRKYYQGAAAPALARTRLYKLAWDLAGDAFGMRQLQYERYYNGDPVRTTAGHYQSYDKSTCLDLAQRALQLFDAPAVTGD